MKRQNEGSTKGRRPKKNILINIIAVLVIVNLLTIPLFKLLTHETAFELWLVFGLLILMDIFCCLRTYLWWSKHISV